MKQAIDNKTTDMWAGLSNTDELSTAESTPTKRFVYEFYTRTTNGDETRWTGLTKTKAQQMHAYTSQSQPSNITAFGWELRT